MNHSDEKKYLYTLMENVLKERDRLTDMYLGLLDRINRIDELERRVIQTVEEQRVIESSIPSSPTISDATHIQPSPQGKVQPEPEIENNHVEDEKETLFEEGLSLEEIIQKRNEMLDVQEDEEVEDLTPRDIIPKAEIENEKDRALRGSRRHGYLNNDKVRNVAVQIMKEEGIPMNAKQILDKMGNQFGKRLTINNFRTNILPRLAKIDDRVERVGKGFYQFRANK